MIAPGMFAAAIFAFTTSFDEIVVAMLLAGVEQKTLPLKMFEGVRDHISPAITAAATLLGAHLNRAARCHRMAATSAGAPVGSLDMSTASNLGAAQIEIPSLETLRRHRGRKWATHRADVLPAWIADMDLLPAPIIRAALRTAIEEGDLGYGPTAERSGIGEAFAAWALHRWHWKLEPAAVMVMPDVVSGLCELYRGADLAR